MSSAKVPGTSESGKFMIVSLKTAAQRPPHRTIVETLYASDSTVFRGEGTTLRASRHITTYRDKYTAVICSLSCPSSALIVSRASRSIARCSGVRSLDLGPPAAGAAQPVSSR